MINLLCELFHKADIGWHQRMTIWERHRNCILLYFLMLVHLAPLQNFSQQYGCCCNYALTVPLKGNRNRKTLVISSVDCYWADKMFRSFNFGFEKQSGVNGVESV